MNPMHSSVHFTPLQAESAESSYQIALMDSICSVHGNGLTVQLAFRNEGPAATLQTKTLEGLESSLALTLAMLVIEHLFTHLPLKAVILDPKMDLKGQFHQLGFLREGLSIHRQAFFQSPWLWHRRQTHRVHPERWTQTGELRHPLRPEVKKGIIYRRYIPTIKKHISFEVLDLEKHLPLFHEWQNQRRVSKFWELDKPIEELRGYLEGVYADPHHFPAIAAVDGEPSGYFEIYWTAEDRLAPYYDYAAYDRGFHFLIGNRKHLGRSYFHAFVESISHFLFLDDPRTQTLLAEPRADNIVLLHYLQEFPYWEKRFEFDFPHKRAALLASRRDDFFGKATFQ